MSTHLSVGLIGDSNHSTRVFGPMNRPASARSSSDAKRAATPKWDRYFVITCSVPP